MAALSENKPSVIAKVKLDCSGLKNEWEVRKWTQEVWMTGSRTVTSNKKKVREVEGTWSPRRVKPALFISTNAKHVSTM